MKLTVEELNALVARMAGDMAGLRQVVTVLIASHPNPALLQGLWHAAKDLQIDETAQLPLFQVREYRESFLASLAGFSGQIDAAQEQGPFDTPDD